VEGYPITLKRVTPETAVLRACMLAATAAGARVWRNNTGVLLDSNRRPVRFGLCVGSSDLIGLTRDGRFLAIECKRGRGGVVTPEQTQFLDTIRAMGGVAILARSGEDVTKALTEE
jgi:hypothetical protein